MYNIVFLGAPGAGKGTQAADVAQRLKLAHIASGDLFRQAVERGDELGKKVRAYLEKGELVPDRITIQMVLGRISAPESRPGVILDGFPRNLRQAEALDKALAGQGKAIDRVVYIKVSEPELVRRLSRRWVCRDCQAPYPAGEAGVSEKCGRCGGRLERRPDDRAEVVRKRLKVYFAEEAPLIDYYAGLDRLVEVAGEASVTEVTGQIISALSRKEPVAG